MKSPFDTALAALLLAIALSQSIPAGAQATPVLLGAASRKVHGAAGTFDLPLGNIASNPTTEPRVGPTHTIVFTFDNPVTAGTATVIEGTATEGAPIFNGSQLVVPLAGVGNAQYVTVAVSNVSTAGGGTGGSGSVRIGFLAGDVNQNRVVSLSDLGLVNVQLSQVVTAANYLVDVNASGTLTLTDKGITNTFLTQSLPPTTPPNLAPQVNAGPDQAVTLPASAAMTGSATDDGLPNPPAALTYGWTKVSGPGTVTFGSASSAGTSASFSVDGVYVLRLTASDSVLSGADDVTVNVLPAGVILPPDPATVAPPLDTTVATTIGQSTAFLYTGANPIQTGVSPGTINPIRAAVIRGRVITRGGAVLAGATIGILDHPEFGQTLSRADGMFDLVVNGGGPLTVTYQKAGYLSAHRQLTVPWQDFALAPDVALIPLDIQFTAIDLSLPTPIQVARGGPVTDADGTRQATLFFPAGTTASMVMPNGSSSPLVQLKVRATEYTVGTNGPQAMPGELPPTSSYTYATEYSIDEALAAGAASVQFSQPVIGYLENFLAFPVGWSVPTGFYDRQRGTWVASDNGLVIKILSISGGSANIDIDGSGNVANAAALAALGVSAAELQSLASLYASGQSLWRVPMMHFSPGDLNWGGGLPPGAQPPNQSSPNDKPTPDPCEATGSIIECQNQVLGQRIPVVGTPYTLNYRSSRVPGYKAANRLRIPLSGASVPSSLQSIQLEILVAGRILTQSFAPTPNQSTTFVWDGKDAYGRTVQGPTAAIVRIGYQYQGVYTMPDGFRAAFALYGSALSSNDTRTVLTLWQVWQVSVGSWNAQASALGGWSLSSHHNYDPPERTLFRGDGRQGNADAMRIDNVIGTSAGTGTAGCSGDFGPATSAALFDPVGVATSPDGSVYFADVLNHVVRRIGPDGIIKTVAGVPPSGGCQGDGGPATMVPLNTPLFLAVGPDGSVYISDINDRLVRRLAPDGSISTVAGNGVFGFSGDGGPATAAAIRPRGIAVGPDGTLYIAHPEANRIRRVGTDGIIMTVVGTGVGGFSGDGGAASLATLANPVNVAIGPDGSLYIADIDNHRVRRVTPDGIITTAAGINQFGFSGDGGPATQAGLNNPEGLAVGLDGSVYIADSNRVRRIGPDGIINTVAGSGAAGFAGDRGPAAQAQLQFPRGVAIAPDGSLYIGDSNNNRIRRVASPLPGFAITDLLIASEDGSELYRFDGLGRHLTTLDPYTAAATHTFGYDASGRLLTVTDVANNVTTIQRTSGVPTAIVGPFGQHTNLAIDAHGYLSSIADPAGQALALGSTADGLLTTLTDPRGALHSFSYDSLGRLSLDQDPAGGSNALSRVDGNRTYTVMRSTALGRTTTYKVDKLGSGDEHRTNTDPSGLSTMQVNGAKGINTNTFADGTTTSEILGADPRWGMQAPIATTAIASTPAGRVLAVMTARTATLTNPNNPLSLSTQVETVAINGQTYTDAYVAVNRTHTLTTPLGRTRTLTLDAQGRPIQTQVTGLDAIDQTYDAQGRLATVTTGSGAASRVHSYSYNSEGYLASIVDPLGRTESFTYDLAGRVNSQTLPDGRSIQFSYDANGNLATLTPPGRPAHSFAYTSVDLTSGYIPPNVGAGTNQTAYTYNADRQSTVESRPDGQTITFGYDTAGRKNALTIARGAFSYGYQATTGNLATITAPGGVGLAYVFDGGLPTSTAWTGTVAGNVTRTYDNDFRVTALAVNGTSIPFAYDNDSLLIQAGALGLSRSPQHGLLTGTTLGSAIDTWTYNGFAEPTVYTATYGGPTVFASQLTRDKLGRITQKIETIGGVTDTYVYSYDLAGRLTGVAKNAVTTATYTYDNNDNRLSLIDAGGTKLGTYDNQDRQTQYGSITYTYSANGELQSRTSAGQVTTFQYDALGNLMAVALPTGTSITYLVDGSNRRVGKQVDGLPTQRFLYQDNLKPIAELDAGNNVVSRFVYATRDNVPDYMIKGGATYRIVTDHLGSPRLVVNIATGAVAQRMDYDEFGRVSNDTSPGFQPFGFAGGLYDKDTQLVRFGARDYDAATGRWTAKDPILFAGGQANLYAYVRNDPVNLRDPGGLQSLPDFDKQQQQKNKDSCPPPKIKPPPKKDAIKEYQKTREEFAGEKSSQSAKDYANSVKNNFTSVGGNY